MIDDKRKKIKWRAFVIKGNYYINGINDYIHKIANLVTPQILLLYITNAEKPFNIS